jgi:hypothetical protein
MRHSPPPCRGRGRTEPLRSFGRRVAFALHGKLWEAEGPAQAVLHYLLLVIARGRPNSSRSLNSSRDGSASFRARRR